LPRGPSTWPQRFRWVPEILEVARQDGYLGVGHRVILDVVVALVLKRRQIDTQKDCAGNGDAVDRIVGPGHGEHGKRVAATGLEHHVGQLDRLGDKSLDLLLQPIFGSAQVERWRRWRRQHFQSF